MQRMFKRQNLHTAWDCDSPRGATWGLLGNGTTNFPSGARQRFSSKCCTMNLPSGDRQDSCLVFSQTFRSKSSPVATRVWWDVTQASGESWLVWPASTHPNTVSKATGVSDSLVRQPYNNACFGESVNTKEEIDLAGCRKSGPARIRLRWFQFEPNETGWTGSSHVTRGKTMVVKTNLRPLWIDDNIVRLAIICNVLRVRPAIPDIVVFWLQLAKDRPLTRRSDTNEAEEAGSLVRLWLPQWNRWVLQLEPCRSSSMGFAIG